MGLDYLSCHLIFTIPPALLLTLAAKPALRPLDALRIGFIVTVAFTATLPWDSQLIRSGIWTYPADSVLGPTLLSIPIEELFFFVIQTYITSLLYVILCKTVLLAQHLHGPPGTSSAQPLWAQRAKLAGEGILIAATALGGKLLADGGNGTYTGFILFWACPFLLLTWWLSGDLLLSMPWTSTVLPIVLPTTYLWLVDNVYLGRGTWAIADDTKLGIKVFGSLELEEALFFLITNSLIVFGIAAFDHAVAVCDLHPELFPEPADTLPIKSLLLARALPASKYNTQRIHALREAVLRLRSKSRSFFLASFVFPGRVRIDLTFLYSYCRVADDLIDNAESPKEALSWIAKLKKHLDVVGSTASDEEIKQLIYDNFPPSTRSALEDLPTDMLSKQALYDLLDGFRTDVEFDKEGVSPIHDEEDLELYASRVASTVGELCLDVVFHHNHHSSDKALLYSAAKDMGIALQYVNIVRDVEVDARIGRVYLPTRWLDEEKLTPRDVLAEPSSAKVLMLRQRLLGKAMQRYRESRPVMDLLPREARGAMVVAVESYMEIGRVLAEGAVRVEGKATVPVWRRVAVAWKALMTN